MTGRVRAQARWAVVLAAVGWSCSWARELDPGACATRFDVQRDKIIRTEESREMGARYLSELDVGSRHECRRLCCETDACDVFVYEEKVSYLTYLPATLPQTIQIHTYRPDSLMCARLTNSAIYMFHNIMINNYVGLSVLFNSSIHLQVGTYITQDNG